MKTRARRITALLIGAALAVGVAASPSSADPSQPGESTPISELALAHETGRSVIVDALTTETELVEANPDGTLTLVADIVPVRVAEDGDWRPVDTTLAAGADGRFEPARTAVDMSFSAGGDDVLATSRTGDGEVTLRAPFLLPEPMVDGDTLTYAEVLPGVDMVVHVGAEAYSEVLVIKDAAAAANPALGSLEFSLSSPSLTFETGADGRTEALNADGDPVFASPTPFMWDAAKAPTAARTPDSALSADRITTVEVDAFEAGDTHSTTVTLTPPTELLTGDDVTYPVYIDPSIGPARLNYAVVRNNGASSYYNDSAQELRVGYCGWSGCSPYYSARAYFSFKVTTLNAYGGKKPVVRSASVNVTQVHNGSAAASSVQLHRAGAISSATKWAGPIGALLETQSKAGTGGIQFAGANVKTYVQEQTDAAELTFALRAPNETDPYQWKRFGNAPTLTVVYAFPVGTPTGFALTNALTCGGRVYARTKTPAFTAVGHEYNSTGAVPIDVHFEILDPGGAVKHSGMVRTTRDKAVTWTAPTLADGDYGARVRTKNVATGDNTDTMSPWTATLPFTVDTTASAVPTIASSTHPLGYNEKSGTLAVVKGDKTGGAFVLASPDTRITGFAYAFNNPTAPAYTGANCVTAADSTPDKTQGFVKATGGTATLALPATVTGESTLLVKTIDEAGNASAPTALYRFDRSATTTEYKNFTLQDAASGSATWASSSQAYVPDGSLLYAASPAANSRYSVTFPVGSAGTWQLAPMMVRSPGHGKVRFAVDGQDLALDGFDDLGNPVVVTSERNLSKTPGGEFYGAEVIPIDIYLTAGTHTLTVVSVGAGDGGGTSFGLDALRLTKTG